MPLPARFMAFMSTALNIKEQDPTPAFFLLSDIPHNEQSQIQALSHYPNPSPTVY